MTSLRFLDLLVIGLYFAAMVAVGWLFSRRVKTTEDYFVGNRSYPGWVAGVSLFGAQISSITGNGYFLYYDPTDPANAYLNAQTYSLAGGGAVQPVAASVKIVSTARLANQHILITAQGVPNRLNSIQASPDLIQPFVAIGTALADANGNFTFDDPNAGSFSQRFYRAAFP